MTSRVINADCREAMREMDADSVDAIVTDPPYGLSFMGKGWDHGTPGVEFWAEALRVAKPGAHLLAFGGTRTFHRLTCAIEDAGWEIRDCVMWLYGSGFPKSLDVSKAIDKAAGAKREVTGTRVKAGMGSETTFAQDAWKQANRGPIELAITAPATDAARQWAGWGTALKPAWEPIIVARKPLRGTVAANVQQFGTGALNIDACRIPFAGDSDELESKNKNRHADFGSGARENNVFGADARERGAHGNYDPPGRWPANVCHDGSDEVVALFPAEARSAGDYPSDAATAGMFGDRVQGALYADTGSAARFFYTAKASKADREQGVAQRGEKNHHPTVKPVALMRYLCRLVTPPGGIVLDPFCGSGSTGKAALLEGFDFVGIELDPEYAAIADDRIYAAAPLFAGTAA